MSIFDAILYGFVQGIAEFLPISSSAHLILLPRFLGQKDPGLAFDVFMHLGTLIAVLIYFRREWFLMGQHFYHAIRSKPTLNSHLGSFVLVATLPALLVGAMSYQWVETVFRGNGVLIWTLSMGGILLYWVDYFSPRKNNLNHLTYLKVLWIGIVQCFSLIPGVSRSGSAIIGARLIGLDRVSAAQFSFLMAAPVTLAAIVFELRHFRVLLHSSEGLLILLIAGGSSFLFGYLSISFLLNLLKKISFLSFAVYRLVLAWIIYRIFL